MRIGIETVPTYVADAILLANVIRIYTNVFLCKPWSICICYIYNVCIHCIFLVLAIVHVSYNINDHDQLDLRILTYPIMKYFMIINKLTMARGSLSYSKAWRHNYTSLNYKNKIVHMYVYIIHPHRCLVCYIA